MQLEQKLFEEAIDKGKEEIRAWFATRTDKEEFKQKPVARPIPKINLPTQKDVTVVKSFKIKMDKQVFVPPSKHCK